MMHEVRLCEEHIDVFCSDLDLGDLGWKAGDSAHIQVVMPEGCDMCLVGNVICIECGDDLVSEGNALCTSCLMNVSRETESE